MLNNKLLTGALTLFFISACTQSPARIEMKGQQSYTRGSQSYGSSSSYNASSSTINPAYKAPVPQETVQDAAVNSIGVSDLSAPAPSASSQAPAAKKSDSDSEIITDRPAAPKPAKTYGKPALKTTINPWTNKPRSANEPAKSRKTDLASSNLTWPVAGRKIISSFGAKGEGKANDGINIAASEGEPVWAAADGQVVYASNRLKDFGNMVFIKHSGGKTTSYAHLSKTVVAKNAKVKRGDIIGYVGSTGNVKSSQLFFSLHKGKEAIDPQKYLNRDIAGL